ncbi:S8 family serine peptidase [Thalassotalea crassostreae]|uniref:S8 family serine peptidase n=1 Tax=Thalassotalea crassostreae TaxID=1763536 RepID=UPI0008394B1C|nr:S8 family serine peptidase [Thalassotalea crassostreae]
MFGSKIVKSLALISIFSINIAAAQNNTEHGRLLIKAKDGASAERVADILAEQENHGKRKLKLANANIHLLKVKKNSEKAIAKLLRKYPEIEFVEVDKLVSPGSIEANDNYYANAWHLPIMNLPAAWQYSLGEGITVAVLDSGVNPHTDLSANTLAGYNSVSNNTDVTDINGHGTQVAGTIAALSNNSIGVTSVAWNSKILPVRVSEQSNGYAYWSDVAEGLIWAADNGASIANISYAVSSSSTVTNAAQYFYNNGGLVVASAGNSGTDLNCNDNPFIITVSATGKSDSKASWSDYGNCVDVSAPGVGIYTTTKSGGYAAVSGTSFSSPLTAAVLALLKSKFSNLSNVELEQLLESTADKTMANGVYSKLYGHGRIDAYAALTSEVEAPVEDQQLPEVSFVSPSQNSEHNEQVDVLIEATDNVEIASVELYLQGNLIATDTTKPYSFIADTSAYEQQNIALQARAKDSSGNINNATIEVYISNFVEPEPEPEPADTEAPDISLNLLDGATITSNQTIVVTASDNIDVVRTELYINGQLKASSLSSTIQYGWNIKKVSNGSHSISAKAYDAAGNAKQVQITVTKEGAVKGSKGKSNR